ncbi:hypothetical protein GCM10010112_22210 [Actinoplanes lobatus]|uniref:DUF402 domain-containing protein n=1 Tax=Actinoplanes lobatus TaxID=113568 RepID=A0A7W7MI94_9ACTN|nr:DUF402 domain-containing protein [Actinoplanes lobatus]MBB4751264.1 hypothetical protein [Actinoplanes lobatus]GGN63190.1 hypothetical protein GCM10010112_22210 [Actinoplanes lobatus]GIE44794.1 hypothetical protein Alo02nite_76920 [Actinoplanes lobatus]
MSKENVEFVPGETIYLRHAQRQQVGLVFPMRVVEERGDAVVLWAPAGTRGWHSNMPDGRTMGQTPLPEWSAASRVPAPHAIDHGVLNWHPRGRDYSIRWFYRPDGTFYRWYANLEAPLVLWRDGGMAGLDTVDWDLDVVIEPDRRWAWKDEELFAERLTMPEAYWVDDEDRVRRAGKEVIELVEAGAFPFDGTWCDFRPDPAWPPLSPELPVGWDRPVVAVA